MPLEGLAQEPAGANAGLAGFLRAPLVSAINHLLRSAAWPRARLKPFAGKRVRFDGQLWAFTLVVCDSGEVAEADPGAPDVQISFSPAVALRLLAGDQNAWREGRVEGDTEFAREILAIVQNLRWDAEEDLSHIVGDIAAHRLAQAGSAILRWQREGAAHLARSAALYWTDEQPLLAAKSDIESFTRAVDVLRDDVARLEQRIARIAARN